MSCVQKKYFQVFDLTTNKILYINRDKISSIEKINEGTPIKNKCHIILDSGQKIMVEKNLYLTELIKEYSIE